MGNPTLASLQDVLYNWLVSLSTGFSVQWADQNAPKPAARYLTLKMGSLIKVGVDIQGAIDEDTLAATLTGNREFILSIQSFGAGALQVLEDIRTQLDTMKAQETLRAGLLAIVDSLAVINLTGLYDQQYKERGALDIRFRTHSFLSTGDPSVSYIQAVELEVDTVDPGGNTSAEDVTVGTPPDPPLTP